MAISEQNLSVFKDLVRDYCRQADKTLSALALEIGIKNASILSQKFARSNNAVLTNTDVCNIILALACWKVINYQYQALELLQIMELSTRNFSDEQWHSAPLNELEADKPTHTNRSQSATSSLNISLI
jgi:hypothetical protein